MKYLGMTQRRWFVRQDNDDWALSSYLSRDSRNRILRASSRPCYRVFVERDSRSWLGPRSFASGEHEWPFYAGSKGKSHDGLICRMRPCFGRSITGLALIFPG